MQLRLKFDRKSFTVHYDSTRFEYKLVNVRVVFEYQIIVKKKIGKV